MCRKGSGPSRVPLRPAFDQAILQIGEHADPPRCADGCLAAGRTPRESARALLHQALAAPMSSSLSRRNASCSVSISRRRLSVRTRRQTRCRNLLEDRHQKPSACPVAALAACEETVLQYSRSFVEQPLGPDSSRKDSVCTSAAQTAANHRLAGVRLGAAEHHRIERCRGFPASLGLPEQRGVQQLRQHPELEVIARCGVADSITRSRE